MITNDKIIEIFCATDEFSKKYEEEIENMPLLSSEGKVRRGRTDMGREQGHLLDTRLRQASGWKQT